MVTCEICKAPVHSIAVHLKKTDDEAHNMTIEQYQAKYPGAPIMSEEMAKAVARKKEEDQKKAEAEQVAPSKPSVAVSADLEASLESYKSPLHTLFGFDPSNKQAFSGKGAPIGVTVMKNVTHPDFIPTYDPDHVFDPMILRDMLMAFEMNLPLFIYGPFGTGKTSSIENICAKTNRPVIRVQHTASTEEAHIVGQWVARNGETHFEAGPLTDAMRNGWVYLADEYDFGSPGALAVYQPVLEGKPLVIKEADAKNRVVKPHPNFRFVATGNTNGSGDETGLYQGTNIQNAANFDRFHVVIEMPYMTSEQELNAVRNKVPQIGAGDAKDLVDFANQVRESYKNAKISTPISPRTVIAIAKVALLKSSFPKAIELCFSNKLPTVDKQVVKGVAERKFGKVVNG